MSWIKTYNRDHTQSFAVHYIIALLWKSGGFTGFALSFRHSVFPSFCHNSGETWISLRPGGQSWSNFIWSIIMVGERLHKVLGQIGSKLWFPWHQIAPIDIMGKTMSPPFLCCFFIRSFFKLAGNKDRPKISDNFEFRPDRTTPYRVRCPWASEKFPIDL